MQVGFQPVALNITINMSMSYQVRETDQTLIPALWNADTRR